MGLLAKFRESAAAIGKGELATELTSYEDAVRSDAHNLMQLLDQHTE